jgi:ABC-type phosphate transport system substrate-binding protein
MLSKKTLLSVLITASLLGSPSAGPAEGASGFQLIVNRENPVTALSKAEASRLFFKKTTRWEHGAQALPVDLNTSSSVRATFSKAVLGRSTSAVKAYWNKLIFSGRGVPPPEKSSDALVVSYVQGQTGAIGYVSATANVGRVKVIRIAE